MSLRSARAFVLAILLFGVFVKLHLTAHPRPLLEVNADVPKTFADLVMQALERDPARRPTLRDLAVTLCRGAL